MNIGWNLQAERDLWRAICAPNRWFDENDQPTTHPESLWWFTHIAFGAEFYFRTPGNRRWMVDRVHKPLLEWLQNIILDWKAQRLRDPEKATRYYAMVIWPRAFGKSVTVTKAASIWNHLDEPDMSSILCSSTKPLSQDLLLTISTVVSLPNADAWFCWLYGIWKVPRRKWTEDYVVHGYRKTISLSEPSFDTTAVGVGMTGYHPLWAVWDDPIYADKLREGGTYMDTVHTSVDATYPALSTMGFFLIVGTRYLDDDVCGRHLRDEGVLSWDGMPCPDPVGVTEKIPFGQGVWRVHFWQAEDEMTGTPTLPEVMSAAEIQRAKTSNPDDFAKQYQNNPGQSEATPILWDQIKACFVDYAEVRQLPISECSIHFDTAFKNAKNVQKGDDSAIVPVLHDDRPNGLVYLHTDHICASNAWRDDQFNDELLKRMRLIRKEGYRIKCLTDEKETGGKEGVYARQIDALLRGAGFPATKFYQFNRQGTNKRVRIRASIGFWTEGYVRILLHKDAEGKWIIPPAVSKLLNQILRIDVVKHDDLADCTADIWVQGVWRKPSFDTYPQNRDEGMPIRHMGDDAIKAFERPLTNEEVIVLATEGREFIEGLGPHHGHQDPYAPQDVHSHPFWRNEH